jgi:SAM-dependent methyltransferase
LPEADKTGRAMPITLLTGLAGSGKSTRLLETVNAALEQGRPALTFACSDAPWLRGREDIQVYQVLTCRRPGLVAPLHHFVTAQQSAEILRETAPGTLVAFEEAQYFGPSLVPHWLEADRRGLHLLIASPSGGQLRRLNGHACDRVHLVIPCQRCGAADAVSYFRRPDREATISVCEACREEMVREGHRQILERLRAMPPSPGQEVTQQPVELPECAAWHVTRPDCSAVAGLMAFTIRRVGLEGQASRLSSYLDVGCGTGYFCHRLGKLRFFCEGVDASSDNITVARLLDSYLRRDHSAWITADPCQYLGDARGRRFDVTSAFDASRWLPPGDTAAACLRRLFDVTERLCFVTAGHAAEGAGPDNAEARLMLESGLFAEVLCYEAAGHGLATDLFVGIKVPGGRPADAIRRVSAGSTIDNLLEESDALAARLARKSKMLDTLMVRLADRLSPQDLLDGPDGELPADVARELTELREQVESENKAAEYRALVWRVRLAAQAVLPPGADVAVVSRGDDELLKLEGRRARHFPQDEVGIYSGSYPANSEDAVAQLEALRVKGVSHLLLPSTAFWWLDHYDGLRRHLERNGRLVARDGDCAIYALAPHRAPLTTFPSSAVDFRCNICGTQNTVPPERLERESRSCSGCGSSVRLRAVIHVLSTELFGRSLPLLEFPQRKDLVGAGMTDPDGYALGLARKFSYTNTYYHQEPRLDITAPDAQWAASLDFLISSEVFEHVPPPVSLAFDNLRRLMKPGGAVVFTVPYVKADRTVEHFPDLNEYNIAVEHGRHVLRNRTRDGRGQRFDNLVFHGGPGETLEMRVFGEAALLEEFRRAGFGDVKVHSEPCPEYGIYWRSDEGLPVSARVLAGVTDEQTR